MPERFGRRQGYAFITFENAADVDKAVLEVNGKDLLGREMKVQKATSSGPYPSEEGEHGEAASGENRKTRPRFGAKVNQFFSLPFFHAILLCLGEYLLMLIRKPLVERVRLPGKKKLAQQRLLPRGLPKKPSNPVVDVRQRRRRPMEEFRIKRMLAVIERNQLKKTFAKGPLKTAPPAPLRFTLPTSHLITQMTRYEKCVQLIPLLDQVNFN